MNKKGFAVSGILYTILLVFLAVIYMLLMNFKNKKNLLDQIKEDAVCEGEVGKVYEYDYTGNIQELDVPCSGYYKIELWGAEGGSASYNTSYSGGKGAYTSGLIELAQDQKLYVQVGGQGESHSGTSTDNLTENGNGYNGGGSGSFSPNNSNGGGGGGATDIRLVSGDWDNFDSLKSRIMVAAGGGGAKSNSGNGEAGTGLGSTSTTFGKGNNASTGGAGGGSGYYGGTSGNGGSSYISGHNGSVAILETSTASNIQHSTKSVHYSGLYFVETRMIDGQGYEWTTEKAATVTGMPTHGGGGTMNGNSGDGYAKITYLGKKYLTTFAPDDSAGSSTCDVPQNTKYTFDYTESAQVFDVPCNGYYKVELWGAAGITNIALGGYTSGEIQLYDFEKLYVYVGGSGQLSTYTGFNGGGAGREANTLGSKYGGGATDVRYFSVTPTGDELEWDSFNGLKSRIMVAGGGGGFTSSGTRYTLGAGGGLTGYTFKDSNYASNTSTGGTQTSGGVVTNYSSSYTAGTNGSFGKGGTGGGAKTGGSGGGGGGYYGGAGGSRLNTGSWGGGGGSSFISGHDGCDSVSALSTSLAIIHTGSSEHYSGKVFTNTKMIDGNGYAWTNTKGSVEQMPNPNGGYYASGVGRDGNGYAVITFLGEI